MPQARTKGVKSIEVAIPLLRALARHSGAMTLGELSRETGMASGKAHRYLHSFIEAGMVSQIGTGRYDLGPAAAEIGISAVARIEPVNRAADALTALVEQTGLSATLAVWGTHGATVVRWEKAATGIVTTLGVGSVLPVTRSATGRVFLAWLPDRLLGALVAAEGSSLTMLAVLRDEIRRTGIATADAEFIPGLYAISAPVMDAQGAPAAVITLIGTKRDLLEESHPARDALLNFCSS